MHVRVYLESGPRVAHLVGGEIDAYQEDSKALCGREPWPQRWYGDSTMEQRVEARKLPLCVSCLASLRRRGGV